MKLKTRLATTIWNSFIHKNGNRRYKFSDLGREGPYFVKQNRESTKGIRGEKSSKDMASSRNLVSTIGTQASPTMGDGTRCPEG